MVDQQMEVQKSSMEGEVHRKVEMAQLEVRSLTKNEGGR